MKRAVVIGLGIFGSNIARDLFENGFDVVAVDNMTEEKLAEKCSGYDYLMLNMDFLPFPDPNKMDKLTEKFFSN